MNDHAKQTLTQTALQYGRNAEPLPDLHIFSCLSELDAVYASDLAQRRARQETLEREILELAKYLAEPLAFAAPKTKRRITDRDRED